MDIGFLKKNYHFIYLILAIAFLFGLIFKIYSPAVFCLIIITHMLFLMVIDVYPVEFVIVSSLALLMLGSAFQAKSFLNATGQWVISTTPNEGRLFVGGGLDGFADPTMITVGALFVVANGVQNAGIMNFFLKVVLGKATTASKMLLRLSMPLMTLSAFLNNTPIVAIFTPYLREWALKNRIAPSKVLIPLSYITIFGGMFTLIGTSTNLVVQGLAVKAGIQIGFWDPIFVAFPCAILGILYIYFLGDKLLPNRTDLLENTKEKLKEYIFELEVSKGSIYHHQNILESGLRDLEDCFLFEVHRGDEIHTPVKGSFVIKEGDFLFFKGSHDHLIDLLQNPGLSIPGKKEEFSLSSNAQYLEVVIAPSSPLIDKTIDEVWFNRTYDAAVLAFHRNGEDLEKKISQIPLKMGDTLILLAGKGFRRIWQKSNVFNFATPLREDLDKKKYFGFAIICLFLMIIIPELDSMFFLKNYLTNLPKIPLVLSAIICACLFIQFKLVEKSGIMKLIEWNVLIVIGASFGISNALQNSGAAALVGNWILFFSGDQSPWIALALVYLGANLLTEMISNNAAAAIFFPLALTTATALHVNPVPFIMAIMIAASAGYSTPYGYQTHMMVYGPGNYKNLDFVKIGVPLNIMYFVISVLIIPLIWKF